MLASEIVMKNWFVPLLFSLFMAMACTKEDPIAPPTAKPIIPIDFRVVGLDETSVYQMDYRAQNKQNEIQNLSAIANVSSEFLTLRELNGLLSFFEFGAGAFSLIQWDTNENTFEDYSNFWFNEPSRGIAWGISDSERVYFGYFAQGSRNLSILDVDLDNGAIMDIGIDFAIAQVFQPIQFGGKIYFSYRDQQGNNKFTYYNTTTQSSGPILNFDNRPIGYFINSSGDLVIFENGTPPILTRYNHDSLITEEERIFGINLGLNSGPIVGADWVENRFYYPFINAQPARFFSTPAVYDFETNLNHIISLESVIGSLDNYTNIQIINQQYNATGSSFLVGYGRNSGASQGGVLQISIEGTLINEVSLPFFPLLFVHP